MHFSDDVWKNTLSFQYSIIGLRLSNLIQQHIIFLDDVSWCELSEGEEKVAHWR